MQLLVYISVHTYLYMPFQVSNPLSHNGKLCSGILFVCTCCLFHDALQATPVQKKVACGWRGAQEQVFFSRKGATPRDWFDESPKVCIHSVLQT